MNLNKLDLTLLPAQGNRENKQTTYRMAPVLANQERGPQGLDDPQRKVSGEPQGSYLPLQHLRNNESGSSYNRRYEGTNPQTG